MKKLIKTYQLIPLMLIIILLCGCSSDKDIGNSKINSKNNQTNMELPPSTDTKDNITPNPDSVNEDLQDTTEAISDNGIDNDYSFINAEGGSLVDRINPPQGYTRIYSTSDEFTGYLRLLPLKDDGSNVLLYNGQAKGDQNSHVAVFDFDVGTRDLQQCADSVIRVYAEYFWSQGEYDKISFHLTNGFLMDYTQWRDGNRIVVEGNNVRWSKTKAYDNSYETFRSYLNSVFAYAGTLSLSKESKEISLSELLPGDMFLEGGSPGHCILVVDVAEDEAGNRCYLLAQGYMPAQEFHIIKNPNNAEDPWYYASDISFPLKTPSWTFSEGSIRRWGDFPLVAAKSITTMGSSVMQNKSNEVTFLAVGDNLVHIEVIKSGIKQDGTLDYRHLFQNLKPDFMTADIAVINQETILGGKEFAYTGYPAFNSPIEIGEAIVDAGFDVILHANNHTLDKGVKAVRNTFNFWKQYPEITVLGINETKEQQLTIPIVEKNGIRLAMLNYTFSLNGYKMPDDMPFLVNMLDKKKMEEDIKKAKEISDFIIVFPHWGDEYVYEASKEQKKLTEFFYTLGVDLVIGTHPHVLQPVEWVELSNSHRMLVYNSLGNYVSYQREAPRMLGGMAQLTIKKDSSGTCIKDYQITPIVTHYENGPTDYHYGVYKLSEYTKEQALRHGVNDLARNGLFTYQGTKDLARQVLKNLYTE